MKAFMVKLQKTYESKMHVRHLFLTYPLIITFHIAGKKEQWCINDCEILPLYQRIEHAKEVIITGSEEECFKLLSGDSDAIVNIDGSFRDKLLLEAFMQLVTRNSSEKNR
ncbi:hypothetical protein [Jeotgalibacillus soli]|uniref:Uncharacterized protein n=1 Tax=Jeotgalibacillus soli TaxID=889306 RepID=A0A0C2VF71_9BACL|nr:hypothetical protein [Jeotgalibacillus soli]KIL42658.1 hypothetical protein KP78_38810 [Jeotgalibacillus soli]